MKVLKDNSESQPIKVLGNLLPKNLIVLSHLRWDFVFQRPQHLLTRFSKFFKVSYIEEPIFDATGREYYQYLNRGENIIVMVPHLNPGQSAEEIKAAQRSLFDSFMSNKKLSECAFWYYTPMALDYSRKHTPEVTIFDCMDELSAFKFAPQELKNLEKELLNKADIVFTGGNSLYEAKKNQHSTIYAFPSSIEKEHFEKARTINTCPPDQINTSKPKLGFYGVIDERFDIELIREVADARPDWEICLIGPVVKVDPETLPKNKNIHYMGPKSYQELPTYLAQWDIALIPFMLNESTKYISPTKTPEYLAAGKPVISTPINDVVRPYGQQKLVHIIADANGFIEAAEKELATTDKSAWLQRVDKMLAKNSWDQTCGNMLDCIKQSLNGKAYNTIAQ